MQKEGGERGRNLRPHKLTYISQQTHTQQSTSINLGWVEKKKKK
jgi:hypothetical protein